MFEFYEFNTTNVIIVLVGTFTIYYILNKTLYNKIENDEKDHINIELLIISFLLSIILSIIISYFLTAKDEELLTDNYWEIDKRN